MLLPGEAELLVAVGAVLAGARSYAAIADWAATAEQALRSCGRPPHASTIRSCCPGWTRLRCNGH